jgi:hypothetical protein
MRKLSNIVIVVSGILFFTCLCISSKKCTVHDNPIYAQDELHIPGIYLSTYFKKCIKETNNKSPLHDQKLKYTSLTINDTTHHQPLNQFGVHVPAYIRKKLAAGQQ